MTIGVFVIAVSCGSGGKPPEGILTQEEMVYALTHIYIAEEKVKSMNLSMDSSRQVFDSIEKRVLNKWAINDSLVKKSIDYYMEHPKELEQIYATLVDSLNLMEQRATVKD